MKQYFLLTVVLAVLLGIWGYMFFTWNTKTATDKQNSLERQSNSATAIAEKKYLTEKETQTQQEKIEEKQKQERVAGEIEEEIFFKKQQPSEDFLLAENKNTVPYSKENFLPYNFIPEDLVSIPTEITYKQWKLEIVKEAEKDLLAMFAAAEKEGLDMKIVSAYRSYDQQEKIKISKIHKHGKERADAYSADPGQSEHQLGTTVDISTQSIQYGLRQDFENTPEYQWLRENAEKYGFKLSYPKENPHFSYEPWHYRWWGIGNI